VYREVVGRVFSTLSSEDGVSLTYIWLLKPRTVPKTTSGKIARKWCQVRAASRLAPGRLGAAGNAFVTTGKEDDQGDEGDAFDLDDG
jgi:hypothetical protein